MFILPYINIESKNILFSRTKTSYFYITTGDVTKGELGYAAIPGKEDDFKESISKTIQYAKALDCKM